MLEEKQFKVMYAIKKGQPSSIEILMDQLKMSHYLVKEILEGLEANNCVKGLRLTQHGESLLDEYKVDNAIIMAAGFSSRSMPLSGIIPKGLFEVKGEVLIERQISQLLEAGIKDIIVVTGYKAEKFDYLVKMYPEVRLVYNAEYNIRNNLSSLYVVREYMKNSYICCSDNYFGRNVYETHVYDSYYGCKYSDEYVNEDCIVEVENNYIKKIISGESHCWYTIAEAYFNRAFSQKFVEYLQNEYFDDDVLPMRMDDFHIKHIDDLLLRIKEYSDEDVMEFDRLDEFMEFDPDFVEFYHRIMQSKKEDQVAENSNALIKRWFGEVDESHKYVSVPTEQREGRLHLNENLFGPSPKCFDVLRQTDASDLFAYNMKTVNELVSQIAAYEHVDMNQVFVNNGSSEVIRVVFGMVLQKGDIVLLPDPGWGYYDSIVNVKSAKAVYYDVVLSEQGYRHDINDIQRKIIECKPKMVVIITPNNPTGNSISEAELLGLANANKETLFFVDQAYAGFEKKPIASDKILCQCENVIISKTFSKYWGLANIRLGYGLASAEVKRVLEMDLPPFGFSSLSEKVALAALRDDLYYENMAQTLITVRDWLIDELNCLPGIEAYVSNANFVYAKLASNLDPDVLKSVLEKEHLKLRFFHKADGEYVRISIAPKEVMEKLMDCIRYFVQEK